MNSPPPSLSHQEQKRVRKDELFVDEDQVSADGGQDEALLGQDARRDGDQKVAADPAQIGGGVAHDAPSSASSATAVRVKGKSDSISYRKWNYNELRIK